MQPQSSDRNLNVSADKPTTIGRILPLLELLNVPQRERAEIRATVLPPSRVKFGIWRGRLNGEEYWSVIGRLWHTLLMGLKQ